MSNSFLSDVFLLLPKIFGALSRKLKIKFFTLLIIMILAGLLEFLSLSSISTFLSSLQNNNLGPTYSLFSIQNLINFQNHSNQVIANALTFIILVIFTSCTRLINIRRSFNLASLIGIEFGYKIFKNDLFLSYEEKINNDSKIIISALTIQIQTVVNTINLYLQFLTSAVITIFLSIGLLTLATRISAFAFLIFTISYCFIALKFRKKLFLASRIIADNTKLKVGTVQESIGALREIIMGNLQNKYLNEFYKYDKKMRFAQANSQFFALFPRYLIEGIALSFISIFALIVFLKSKDSSYLISTIGVFALGLQKLLPCIQSVYGSWASIKTGIASVNEILFILKRESEPDQFIEEKFVLKKNIILRNISYQYSASESFIFRNLNIEIKSGEIIGIIGKTGLGKSTLIDIIMGLLKPKTGNLLIDDIDINLTKNNSLLKTWRASISYVPQVIFLSNKSFMENIAFGEEISLINLNRVKQVAKIAQIDDFITKSKMGYETVVGERGILLSGGQRQRISIARALYRKSNLLIFDEATSALDYNTEKLVIDSILENFSNVTILMISHKKSSLDFCNRIINLEDL